jgi:hypothetical protein
MPALSLQMGWSRHRIAPGIPDSRRPPRPRQNRAYTNILDTIRDLIHEIAEALRTTASSLEETDQGIASQFRG